MAHGDKDSTRLKPWREIAAEIAQEQDSAKLLELVWQLLDALDKQVPEHRRSRKGPKVQR